MINVTKVLSLEIFQKQYYRRMLVYDIYETLPSPNNSPHKLKC